MEASIFIPTFPPNKRVHMTNEISDIIEQDLEALFTRNKNQILNIRQKFSAFDDKALLSNYNSADIQLEFDEDYTTHVSFTSPTTLPDTEYQELFTKLNQEQRDYVMHVSDTIEKSDEQIFHFLTGGAAIGKSL
ncbi:Ferredoxin--NADP reductase, root isozyme, chloroplastic, partial [Frankliniella fusca]